MIDREKVIEGLKKCAAIHQCFVCESCEYPGDDCAIDDALALLKAQEPRVMALEELEDWDGAVFFEAFETDMYYALIENVDLTAGMDGEYVLVNVVPGEHHRRIWSGEHYGEIWRCWTFRPDEKRRAETPWE